MIQVNLLPDVKREYLRAQQTKHMVTVIAIIATIAAVSLLVLLFAYVQVVQPRHRANLQKDIDSGLSELKNKNDAVKIVTVQGVLEQLPALEDKKLITSRVFDYLTEFTPRDVSYSEVKIDLATNMVTLAGQTTTLERANVLANNLKSATFSYKKDSNEQTTKPFTNVVFASLGKSSQGSSNKSVGFQLSFQIDPVMFAQGISNQKINVNAASEELLLPSAKPFEGGAQ